MRAIIWGVILLQGGTIVLQACTIRINEDTIKRYSTMMRRCGMEHP
jgi:hypothetical protein